jgi:hypothetical protein
MDYDDYVRELSRLPVDKQEEVVALLDELAHSRLKNAARVSFLPFVKYLWSGFVEGSHQDHRRTVRSGGRGHQEARHHQYAARHTKSDSPRSTSPPISLEDTPIDW